MANCHRTDKSMTTQVFVTISSLKIHTPSACLGQMKKHGEIKDCPAQHKRSLKTAQGLRAVSPFLPVNFRAED